MPAKNKKIPPIAQYRKQYAEQLLVIHDLNKKVESHEARLTNLRMVFDTYELEMNQAKSQTIQYRTEAIELRVRLYKETVLREGLERQLRRYEAENGWQLLKRVLRKLLNCDKFEVRIP